LLIEVLIQNLKLKTQNFFPVNLPDPAFNLKILASGAKISYLSIENQCVKPCLRRAAMFNISPDHEKILPYSPVPYTSIPLFPELSRCRRRQRTGDEPETRRDLSPPE
jgi:hypothetical protein